MWRGKVASVQERRGTVWYGNKEVVSFRVGGLFSFGVQYQDLGMMSLGLASCRRVGLGLARPGWVWKRLSARKLTAFSFWCIGFHQAAAGSGVAWFGTVRPPLAIHGRVSNSETLFFFGVGNESRLSWDRRGIGGSGNGSARCGWGRGQ